MRQRVAMTRRTSNVISKEKLLALKSRLKKMIEKICPKIPHTFNARYGLVRHLHKICEGTYIIEGSSRYSRGAEGMADFEGGPFITVGMPMAACCDVSADKECGITIPENETVDGVKFIRHEEACALKGISPDDAAPEYYCYVQITTKMT